MTRQFSIRSMLATIAVIGVGLMLVRILLFYQDKVVLRIEGNSQGRIIYLDSIPLGPTPVYVRESQLKRICPGYENRPLPPLEVRSHGFGGPVLPVLTAEGRHPLLWVKAQAGDQETVGTPFGLAFDAAGSGVGGSEERNEAPGMVVNPGLPGWYRRIRPTVRSPVAAHSDFTVTLTAPPHYSGKLPDETEIRSTTTSDREPLYRSQYFTVAKEDWVATKRGYETTISLPGLAAGHYWIGGGIYYGRENFDRRKGGDSFRVSYFEVSELDTQVAPSACKRDSLEADGKLYQTP